MLDSVKEWWHGLWVEHYELTVWFDDQTVTNLEDNTQTTTKSKKVFNLKSLSKKTQTHIICLLYTSPSPRDRQKSRMPSSA